LADLVTGADPGAECAAGWLRMLGMVTEIQPGVAEVRLGAGVSDCLLFRDGFCFPLELMAAPRSHLGAASPHLHP
jgi:hypothetical protein